MQLVQLVQISSAFSLILIPNAANCLAVSSIGTAHGHPGDNSRIVQDAFSTETIEKL